MEGKMKSKIEKIVSNINHLELNEITNKINEIIDYLNSQDQEEENNFVHTVGTPMLEGTTTCSQDTPEEKTVEERMKEMEIPYMETAKLEELNENERRKRDKLAIDMLDNAYKLHYVKDTPEEWVCPKCGFDDCYPYKNSEDFGLIYCPACSELVKLNSKKK